MLERDIAFLKPDLVISTIPLTNVFVANACENLGIPFVITCLDSKPDIWVFGLKKFSYKKFIFTISLYTEFCRKELQKKGFDLGKIRDIPYPVRHSFYEKISKEEARDQFGLPQGKFLVMILMGGSGSWKIKSYAELIAQNSGPDLHIVACVGANKNLEQSLRDSPEKEKISTVGFTEAIGSLMKASDLLISKPGPTTIAEAMVSGIPLLLDKSSHQLLHEKPHLDYVEKNFYGTKFCSTKELLEKVKQLQNKDLSYQKMKEKMNEAASWSCRYRFDKKLKNLVDELL